MPQSTGDRLKEPFPPEAVGWKPQSVKQNRALAVAYISARDVMTRLDAVVGVGGWSDHYDVRDSGAVMCHLRVRIDGEWVEKCDIGSPSDQPDAGDSLKAAVSDALKRAGVKYGVGRYLYDLPMSWCDYDPVRKVFVQTPALPEWAVPRKMATAQQVHLLDHLLVEAKVGEEEQRKWLDKACAEEWADLTQAQITKCIEVCTQRAGKRA